MAALGSHCRLRLALARLACVIIGGRLPREETVVRSLLWALPLLAVLLLAAALGTLNRQPVQVDLLIVALEMRLATLLALTLLCGAICGAAAMLWPLTRLKWRLRRLQRQLARGDKPA